MPRAGEIHGISRINAVPQPTLPRERPETRSIAQASRHVRPPGSGSDSGGFRGSGEVGRMRHPRIPRACGHAEPTPRGESRSARPHARSGSARHPTLGPRNALRAMNRATVENVCASSKVSTFRRTTRSTVHPSKLAGRPEKPRGHRRNFKNPARRAPPHPANRQTARHRARPCLAATRPQGSARHSRSRFAGQDISRAPRERRDPGKAIGLKPRAPQTAMPTHQGSSTPRRQAGRNRPCARGDSVRQKGRPAGLDQHPADSRSGNIGSAGAIAGPAVPASARTVDAPAPSRRECAPSDRCRVPRLAKAKPATPLHRTSRLPRALSQLSQGSARCRSKAYPPAGISHSFPWHRG